MDQINGLGMSKDKMQSPTRFNGEMDHFFDANFTEEISQKMQVPKRIKVNGENENDVTIGVGGNQQPHIWDSEKLDMHVPDRILVVDDQDPELIRKKLGRKLSSSSKSALSTWSVDTCASSPNNHRLSLKSSDINHLSRTQSSMSCVSSAFRHRNNRGQDQLFGTRGAPLEATHENAVLTPEPGLVRVQTPPRVLTLTDHYFPSADDAPPMPTPQDEVLPQTPIQFRARPRFDKGDHVGPEYRVMREETPSLNEGMTTNDEIAHLRRQLAKVNRRVMYLELENVQRRHWEKIACFTGMVYIFCKVFIWLRNT